MSERAKCPICGGYGTIDPDDTDGAKALALANAAPDLLTALEEVIETMRERDEDLGYNCWPQATEAIAKARGEAE